MTFSNPSFLWAALGIVVPLAIHLWSRKKEFIIKIGSIKLLKKSEPAHSSSIRPNEWWLLALRMLTILLLTFILAGPHLNTPVKNIPLTYLVEPALLQSEKMEKLLDTLPVSATRVLANGFPEITDYDSKTSDKTPPKYWQLAQEMTSLPSDSIIVFTKALVSGIRGIRPHTDKIINFVIVEDDNHTSKHVLAARRKSDSIELFTMVGDGKRLGFETRKVSQASEEIKIDKSADSVTLAGRRLPLQRNDTLNVLVVYTDSLLQEVRYISAAYRAISKYLERDISVDTLKVPESMKALDSAKVLDSVKALDSSNNIDLVTNTETVINDDSIKNIDSVGFDTYDFAIWLGTNPIKSDSLPYLKYRPDALADALIVPGGQKNEYHLTRRLTSENIISGYLADKLLMLLPVHHDFEDEVAQYDPRSMDTDAFKPEYTKKTGTSKSMERMDLSTWIWGILILVMIAERILAKYRKQ